MASHGSSSAAAGNGEHSSNNGNPAAAVALDPSQLQLLPVTATTAPTTATRPAHSPRAIAPLRPPLVTVITAPTTATVQGLSPSTTAMQLPLPVRVTTAPITATMRWPPASTVGRHQQLGERERRQQQWQHRCSRFRRCWCERQYRQCSGWQHHCSRCFQRQQHGSCGRQQRWQLTVFAGTGGPTTTASTAHRL